MASYYVWSGATGSANGSSWANAHTDLGAVIGKAAGDTLYVAHDHSQSSVSDPSITNSGATNAAPIKIICVNRAGSVPPVSADRRATAQVATTGNANITISDYLHIDGIIFIAGNSTGAASIFPGASSGKFTRFDNCSLRIGSTGAGKIKNNAPAATYVEWNNTTVSFSGTSQGIEADMILKWRNTPSALLGTAVPTTLFIPINAVPGQVECIGVDFSAAGSGKTLAGAHASATALKFTFIDCKLNASVTKSTVPLSHGSTEIDFIRSGSSGVNYTVYRHRKSGLLIEETTIVRTGGASDGTTTISWKIATTANCTYSMPFECPPIAIWNDTTGSAVTATVECIGAAIGTDKEVWLECEFLGDASSPQGSFATDAADILATAANQTSSSETWGGSTAAFKLACTFTPQQKGWIYARVKIGKASSTFYVDPLITLT